MSRRRKPNDPGAFLRLPFVGLLAPDGLIDRLTGDAFKLFVLALTVVDRKNGGLDHGGAQGLRWVPYSLVVRRFGWSPKKVARAFRELLDAEAIVVTEPGGLVTGIRQPSAYQIGAAHPWSGKTRPTSTAGSGTATTAGSGRTDDTTAPLPAAVVGPNPRKRPFPKGFRPKRGVFVPGASSLPPPEEGSRVSMDPAPNPGPGNPVHEASSPASPGRSGAGAVDRALSSVLAGLPGGGEVVELTSGSWYKVQVPDGARVCTRWFDLEEREPARGSGTPRPVGDVLDHGDRGQGHG